MNLLERVVLVRKKSTIWLNDVHTQFALRAARSYPVLSRSSPSLSSSNRVNFPIFPVGIPFTVTPNPSSASSITFVRSSSLFVVQWWLVQRQFSLRPTTFLVRLGRSCSHVLHGDYKTDYVPASSHLCFTLWADQTYICNVPRNNSAILAMRLKAPAIKKN